MTTKSNPDFIIIGAGSSGCAVASRLSENPNTRVLLLEAGPQDRSIYLQMPAALGIPLGNSRFNWYYHSEPDPSAADRRVYEARGRVLGGSSSINGMNWVRGNPWDYDNWAANGLKTWSYAHCLPYFKRAETYDRGPNAYRGGSGPMRIQTCPAEGELFRAFLDAGIQAGYPFVEDHNAFRQMGMHVTQRNVHEGLRWSASRAYLHEPGPRENLKAMTNVLVTRIEVAGKRAVRVHCIIDGQPVMFQAEQDIILAAGTLNTPQLLQLSGIGDADALRQLSIPLSIHLPGVGQNLQNHPVGSLQHEAKGHASIARQLGPLGRLKVALQWKLFKSGLGVSNYFEAGAFIPTDDSVKVPNLQYEFIPFVGEIEHGSVALASGFEYIFALMRPTSRGRVWIASKDPRAAPKFLFNYLSTPEDMRDAIAAVKITRDLISRSAWNSFRGRELKPGPSVVGDRSIAAYLRQFVGTQYHPCGTCRMGTDPLSVVDETGLVHETENLRVVDASTMPTIVSGNLNAPVIMVAEKLADCIRGRPQLTPEPTPYFQL